MRRDFKWRKYTILAALAALLAADAVMMVYSRDMASPARQRETAALRMQLKLLTADVKRAREIQQQMPKIKADCDQFENSLPGSATGYSVVSTDLEQIAQNAGLDIDTLSFSPVELAGRSITEVSLQAAVSGKYKNVVQFLNGLQRSANHYVVDAISLASERGGQHGQLSIKVNLHLRSYFRTAA